MVRKSRQTWISRPKSPAPISAEEALHTQCHFFGAQSAAVCIELELDLELHGAGLAWSIAQQHDLPGFLTRPDEGKLESLALQA